MQLRVRDSSGIPTKRWREACGGNAVAKRTEVGLVWAHAAVMQTQKGQHRGERCLPRKKSELSRTVEIAKKANAMGRRADAKPVGLTQGQPKSSRGYPVLLSDQPKSTE